MREVDRLLGVLRRGFLSGKEIQRELGISQPVMSRLVQEAGSRLIRVGRSVATRYALTREIAGLGLRASVFRIDEQGKLNDHGILHFLAGGGCWLERSSGDSQSFPELPPFVEDMRPQGYIGRGFPTLYPELRLPGRITDWNEDHQLIALALRGEDCVGNLIIGEESLNRFLARRVESYTRADYPGLASGVIAGQPGSSAGGEHPKFAIAAAGDRHLLVKFASGDGASADRWRDLLVAEHLSLEVLRSAGVQTPHSEWFDYEGNRYLEVDRFDRVGRRGRRGVISLFALNCHFLGDNPDNWSRASHRIIDEPALSLSQADVDRVIRLDTFGDLIGNTDRHFGNLSFFAEEAKTLTLTPTPVYDMLPMVFAPAGVNLVERRFHPRPPTALNHRIWHEVATLAIQYWARLGDEGALSEGFRRIAADCQVTLATLIGEHS
ncbi:type II toxin-antitoxin system HipA family toxin YjjJ [Singulisphaera rosea]